MVRGNSRIVRWWICALTLLLVQPVWAATITVKSDRNPVAMNESFRLIFEADGSVDDEPDFKGLTQSFEIIKQSQGTTMQIINGQVTQSRQWTVVLMPKRSGRLVVPQIPFGSDKSDPLVINVQEPSAPTAAASNSALFIEVSVAPAADSDALYVQSQLIYKARLFRAVNIANARLSEPVVSDADAVIEKLGDDREFETTRDGRRYVVLERSYAIFPQQSGPLTIEPLTFEGQVVNRSRNMFDLFDQGGPIRRVRSDGITLDIKGIPATEDSQQWLPAREVQLIESWPDEVDLTQAVTAGEPLTWTLTLIADGLTAAQLPAITPSMPEGLKAYPDQARQMNDKKQDRLIGVRQEKIALIPTRAGEYELPAIAVPWWNTQSNRREVARLPARRLKVVAAPGGEVTSAVVPIDNGERVEMSPVATITSSPQGNGWKIAAALLGLGWLLTAVAWWVTRRKGACSSGVTVQDGVADFSAVKKALQAACHGNDAAAAKEALLAWGRLRWPDDAPGSLAELAGRVSSEPFSEAVMVLNRQLYSRAAQQHANAWHGGELWGLFKAELAQHERSSASSEPVLAPMYP